MGGIAWNFRGYPSVPLPSIQLGWKISGFIMQTLNIHPLKLHSSTFNSCRPNDFMHHRMGLCERMAWMWFAHHRKPSVHSSSVTWLAHRTGAFECVWPPHWSHSSNTSFVGHGPHFQARRRLHFALAIDILSIVPKKERNNSFLPHLCD